MNISKSWKYTLIVGALLLSLGLAVTIYRTISDVRKGIPLSSALMARWKELPGTNQSLPYGGFDPLHTSRFQCGDDLGGLKINEHGIIDNGNPDPVLNTFPEKPKNIFRIFILGSSTVMGGGLERNDQTISAHLEKALNQGPSPRFQVINCGTNGAHSYSELAWFLSELVYYEPDMIICLDGWSDAIVEDFEHDRQSLPHPMMNWDQLNYIAFESMNGLNTAADKWPIIKLLMSSRHALMKQRLYSKNPLFRNSEVLWRARGNFHFLFKQNHDAFASCAQASNVYYLEYLPPYPEESYSISPELDAKLNKRHIDYQAQYGDFWKRETYKAKMKAAYADYRIILSELEAKYSHQPKIRFSDMSDLFANVHENVYIDLTHYNETGTRLIAQRLAEDIQRLLQTSPRE